MANARPNKQAAVIKVISIIFITNRRISLRSVSTGIAPKWKVYILFIRTILSSPGHVNFLHIAQLIFNPNLWEYSPTV